MIILFAEIPFLRFISYATIGNRENLVRIFNESPFQIIFGRTIICVLIVVPIASIVLLCFNYAFSIKNRIIDFVINLILAVIATMIILCIKFIHYGYI